MPALRSNLYLSFYRHSPAGTETTSNPVLAPRSEATPRDRRSATEEKTRDGLSSEGCSSLTRREIFSPKTQNGCCSQPTKAEPVFPIEVPCKEAHTRMCTTCWHPHFSLLVQLEHLLELINDLLLLRRLNQDPKASSLKALITPILFIFFFFFAPCLSQSEPPLTYANKFFKNLTLLFQ